MSEDAKFSNKSMELMDEYHHNFSKLLAKYALEVCDNNYVTEIDVKYALTKIIHDGCIDEMNNFDEN